MLGAPSIVRDNTACGESCEPWRQEADGTLEERRFYCQNWRADVVAVTKSDAAPIEYVRYSAYGEAAVHPVADLNMDGVVTSTRLGIRSKQVRYLGGQTELAES